MSAGPSLAASRMDTRVVSTRVRYSRGIMLSIQPTGFLFQGQILFGIFPLKINEICDFVDIRQSGLVRMIIFIYTQ